MQFQLQPQPNAISASGTRKYSKNMKCVKFVSRRKRHMYLFAERFRKNYLHLLNQISEYSFGFTKCNDMKRNTLFYSSAVMGRENTAVRKQSNCLGTYYSNYKCIHHIIHIVQQGPMMVFRSFSVFVILSYPSIF